MRILILALPNKLLHTQFAGSQNSFYSFWEPANWVCSSLFGRAKIKICIWRDSGYTTSSKPLAQAQATHTHTPAARGYIQGSEFRVNLARKPRRHTHPPAEGIYRGFEFIQLFVFIRRPPPKDYPIGETPPSCILPGPWMWLWHPLQTCNPPGESGADGVTIKPP